jgi:hypothetical protein
MIEELLGRLVALEPSDDPAPQEEHGTDGSAHEKQNGQQTHAPPNLFQQVGRK